MRAGGSRRTNSREVFEYAAKKLGEKGHSSRAEREKCRTKWKKMKEEFTHAKRARETGEGRIAPGIEPFYSRMLEFINGSFDNISPHSTIVRRSSSISSNNNNNNTNNSNSNNNNSNSNNNDIAIISSDIDNGNNGAAASSTPTNSSKLSHAASRASARIAANSNGMSSNDTSDTSSTIVTRTTNVSGSDYSSAVLTPSDSSPASRQNPRLSPGNPVNIGSNNNNVNTNTNRPYPALTANGTSTQNHSHQRSSENHVKSPPEDAFDDMNAPYATHNHNNTATNNNNISHNNNNSLLNSSSDFTNHLPPAEHDADISYRVSTGCRQITIFGDHDVDIKFRGSCVTINKISAEYSTTPGTANNSDI